MENDSYQALLDYSFRILGVKNYSESELRQKLDRRAKKLKLSGTAAAIKKAMERLKELNYLNDQKILENYFEYRLKSRPVGKFLFLHEMHRRGISFEAAKTEWEKRQVDEHLLARELLDRKRRTWGKIPPVLLKRKAAQFLAGRGFAPDTVWAVASEA